MSTIEAIAKHLTEMRRSGRTVTGFPGEVPSTFDAAYDIQDAVLALCPGALAGWKVALVRPEFREQFGTDRYVGPLLAHNVREAATGSMDFAVYDSGNTGIEAEFAFCVTRDLTPGGSDFADALGPLHLAVEIVGSPIADLPGRGPAAAIADHGNNIGFVFGRALADWRARPLDSLVTRVEIDGMTVGEGSAAKVSGGPMAAIAHLVAVLDRRGRRIKAGDWISTGATTGVHRADPGAAVLVTYGDLGTIALRLTKAGA